MSNDKRLDRLERAAARPNGGKLTVYADPDQGGVYWENNPLFSDDPGRKYTQADIDALDLRYVLIIEYTDDWRSDDPTKATD